MERNRAAVQEQLGVRFAYGRQVHSAHVQRTRSAWSDATEPEEADGQATAVRSVAPMVLTADCLPIAVAGGGSVAMIHAGWRGLAAGIVAEGVEAVRELGSGDELVAAIGPGAGACCYEVSEDVHAIFASRGTGVRRGRRLDLKAIAWQQLGRAGVTRVHDAGLCTICSDPGRFFSHRRDGGVTGRQAGIAWLTPA